MASNRFIPSRSLGDIFYGSSNNALDRLAGLAGLPVPSNQFGLLAMAQALYGTRQPDPWAAYIPAPTIPPDQYLRNILTRETVLTGPFSPYFVVELALRPTLTTWANGNLRRLATNGSLSKGTANNSGNDVDVFISLDGNVGETLKEVYNKLDRWLTAEGYVTRRQNVSINIKVGGHSVDLVPGVCQNFLTGDHSLYRRKADTWKKTNVDTHALHIQSSGRVEEIRVLKLWRDQKGFEFPSFYLELTVLRALPNYLAAPVGDLANNVWKVFAYLRDTFPGACILDPANTNNTVSDDLTIAEKAIVRQRAIAALNAKDWNEIVR